MAKIILNKMQFFASHGHYDAEQVKGGRFTVDVEIDMGDPEAVETDKLSDTVDYARIYSLVKKEMAIPSKLLEHIAGRIFKAVRSELEGQAKVKVRISKLNPPLGLVERVCVELEG